jgi:hypothetical protein
LRKEGDRRFFREYRGAAGYHRDSWVWMSSSDEDKLTVSRARKAQRFLSQPFFVAEKFTGVKGKYVPLSDTLDGFEAIINGEVDDLPEAAFYNVGTLDDVRNNAERIQAENTADETTGEDRQTRK